MIVFSGVVSDEIQAQTMKRRSQWFFRFFSISSIIFLIDFNKHLTFNYNKIIYYFCLFYNKI